MAQAAPDEVVEIVLERGNRGLGFNIRGGVDIPFVENDYSIFVTKIREDGAAYLDGRLKEGDKILEINGFSLERVTHNEAAQHFAGETVTLRVIQGAKDAILMAQSSDEQADMQHYLVCDTEDCQKNGQFYCNACHQTLCEQCRDEHLKSPKTKTHEIVLYRHRKHQLPVEKCDFHPKRNVDILCRECQIPLCSKCSTMKEHHTHTFDDLEDIYAEKYAVWQSEFSKIQKYFLPTSQELKTEIEELDTNQIKKIMESIRSSIKAEVESLKNLVDEVASVNLEHTHTIEKSLLKTLKSQETTYDDYIAYLEKMSDEFQKYLSITNRNLMFSKLLKIQSIPETTKPVPPVFTAGHFNKDDVAKLLGKVNVPNIKPENRKIQPMGD